MSKKALLDVLAAKKSEDVRGLWSLFKDEGVYYLEGWGFEAQPLSPDKAELFNGIARYEVSVSGHEWVIADYHGGESHLPEVTRYSKVGVGLTQTMARLSVLTLFIPAKDAIVRFK